MSSGFRFELFLTHPDPFILLLERSSIDQTWICVLDDAKVVLFLHVLDPLPGLALRVDHQRPSPCVGHDDAVVHRKL